jgi:MFS family permease
MLADRNIRKDVNFFKKLSDSVGITRPVLALSVARMADAIGNSILFILIPLYVKKIPDMYFNLPTTVLIGILISIFGFVSSLFQPVMGALTDRLGRRKPLIQIGLTVIGICILLFIFAGHFFDLLILRIIQGIAVAITIPASLALMTAITKRETRGGSMGVYSTFRIIGFSIGPVIGGFLQTNFGFNTAFYAGAGFVVIAIILVHFWVREVRGEVPHSKKSKFKIIDTDLLSAGIIATSIATFLMAGAFSMMTTLENQFNARLSINAVGFGFAFSILMIGRLIFQIPLGHYSDKVGRKPLIITGLIVMGIATVLLGEVFAYFQLLILRLIQGIAAAAIAAPAFAVAADLSKRGGEGRQMSIVTMGFGLGIAFGPLFAGLLAGLFFELPFFALGLMTIAGALVVYKYMPETVRI